LLLVGKEFFLGKNRIEGLSQGAQSAARAPRAGHGS